MNHIYRLFEGFGIELEYMIVDNASTSIQGIADKVLADVGGAGAGFFDSGTIGWSNELARHVIELKNNVPVSTLNGLSDAFHKQVQSINNHLLKYNCRLMPGAMHPFMDPFTESLLWPVDDEDIYKTFDKIFNCKGHGWTNLQSIHCNIAFSNDEEFARLHTAIRLILPLLPALCASSPLVDGKATGILDNRLEFYRNNQKKLPLMTGHVIPETVFSHDEYEQVILQPMYRQIAPYDPDGILQYEWLNSRGAIARFERMAIEIRLMDIQECPNIDIAICALVIECVKALAHEKRSTIKKQSSLSETELEQILLKNIRSGCTTVIDNQNYLQALGFSTITSTDALSIWKALARELLPADHFAHEHLEIIFTHGSLAKRILDRTGSSPTRAQLETLNKTLCDCLLGNRPYV
ncbi:MAG TPA: glutamate-cysteine ligase family protein [Chitinispirillaceae bacterium]|nr:glutamate-cysteine ligase family protein [Chitinispirillaceae bacterium]